MKQRRSGAEGIRTLDLPVANRMLSQLSYRPDTVAGHSAKLIEKFTEAKRNRVALASFTPQTAFLQTRCSPS